MARMADLDALAAAVRSAPGLLGKRDVRVVRRLAAGIDGDDAALVPFGDGYLVVCGEAISPPFLAADPFAAGAAAVVTNVSDVRAMGGRPLALVDMLVSPDEAHAEAVLDGIAWASELLGVPVVGGHVTLGHAPALSASCTGTVRRPLRAAAARAGDVLLGAFALDGRYPSDDARLLHARCATARRSSCARTARRSSRSPRQASATRRATCRCPGSPARCCR